MQIPDGRTPTTGAVGSATARVEDDRLLRGNGQFIDDLCHGALAAAFVRSQHAHARILDIDVSAVLDLAGVVGVYTWEDLPPPTNEPLPVSLPHAGLRAARTPYALTRDMINHVGEPIVMVVAHDRYLAEDACGAIVVHYEPLPTCVGIDNAVRAVTQTHDDVPDNIAGIVQQSAGDVEAELATAPHKITLDLSIERSMASPLEGRGVCARPSLIDNRLTLYTSTQVPHGVRAAVAHMLGCPSHEIDVIAPDIGGAFGVKGVRPWREEVLVAWVARMLHADVRWTEDRYEHFVSSAHERAQEQRIHVGFDQDGRVLAYDIDILHDIGAYSQYGLVVSQNTSSHLLGPYQVQAKRVSITALYTNTLMIAPYRGAGRPEAAFAIERMMDAVAEYLGLDRTVVRERNLIPPDRMPYEQGFRGQDGREVVYDSGDFPASLEKLKGLVGWETFPAVRAEAQASGRRIGIGIGCYVENTGLGPYESATVAVDTDGTVRVTTGLSTQGQGHATSFAQVAAQELGVRLSDVWVTTGTTVGVTHSAGTYASRGMAVGGTAIALASRAVRARALEVASTILEVSQEDLELTDGLVQVKGNPSTCLTLGALEVLSNPLRYGFTDATREALASTNANLAALPPPGDIAPGLGATRYFSPEGSAFANGMHAAIVETDPETAEVKVLRYCVVHDCGTVVNPMIVEGQVHGGVAQGIAGALYERMEYDDHGQLLNASFMDFLMPYATEIPTIEIDHLETPSSLNPLGFKGAGEAGVIPASAAIAAAIEDAEGFPIVQMPISPSELFSLRLLNRR